MGKKTKEELLANLKTIVGDNTSDEVLALYADVSDTYDGLSAQSSEDWKKKYEDNDKAWREKYRERFFCGKDDEEDEYKEENEREKYRYENLFKEG